MPNYCKDCKHLSDTAGPNPYHWTCTKHIREEVNFLDPEKRIHPPYFYCRDINKDGNCSDYERNENGTKT